MTRDTTKEIAELKQRLAAVEQEKAALFKIISHDLRSPMNKLFALIGLFKMADEGLTDEQLNYLHKMEVVISDSLNSLRNLMDLRAIEGKGIKVLFEKINLGNLLKRVVKEYEAPAAKKNIVISFAGDTLWLITDKISCMRILEQLVANAVKYSPFNSEIKITLCEQAEEVQIAVTDGGYGISASEQARLFQKFTVLSSRPTGGESATGIGLYIARWMARNIGGEIVYDNQAGSCFTLYLPKTAPGSRAPG